MSDNIGVRLTGDVSDLRKALGDGGQAVENFSRKGQGELDNFGKAADRAGKSAISLNDVLGLFGAREAIRFGWKAMTGELSAFEQEMVSAQITADKLRNTLNFAVGKDSASRDMVFLRDTARNLGLEFVSTAQQYARLAAAARGTNLEGQQTREIFEAVAKASTVLGMSAQETEGALTAIQQMMSKGKVQAEELRGQLGERLPGAFQIAARSMGLTTAELDKMLQAGGVLADDFLPKFAAQIKKELGDSWKDAADSAQAQQNRYQNAYTEFKQALAEGFAPAAASRQAVIAESFHNMAEAMRQAREEGHSFFYQLAVAFGTDIGARNPFTGISMSAQENTEALARAREELAKLQAQSEVMGKNIYWREEKRQVEEYIERLERALAVKAKLKSDGDKEVDIRSQYPTRSQSYEREDRRLAANQSSLDGIKQRLSGQNQNFQKDLRELYRLYVDGTIKTVEEYRRLVSDLIKEEGGIKKPEHKSNPADGVFKSIAEQTAQLRAQQDAEEKLTTAQKLTVKVLEDLRNGSLKLTDAEKVRMGVALEAMAVEDKAKTEREEAIKLQAENAKIIAKNTEAADKENESRSKVLQGEIQTNERLREEISLIGLDEAARTRRLQVMEEEHIKRLEEDLVLAQNIENNDAAVEAIKREIAVRRERVGLLGDKGQREAEQKQIEQLRDDAKSISDALTDSLMRGGKSFMDYLRDTARTLVLRPIIQAVMQPVAGMVSGLMNGGDGGGAGSNLIGLAAGSAVSSYLGIGAASSALSAGAAGASAAMAGGTTFGAVNAIGGYSAAIGTGATGAAGAAGSLMAGGQAALAAIPVAGWVALGALALYSIFGGKGGGPKTSSGFGALDSSMQAPGGNAPQVVQSIEQTYAGIAQQLGITNSIFKAGLFYATDPKGTAQTQLQVTGEINGANIYSRANNGLGGKNGIENVGRSEEELQAAIALETARLLLTAVQKADLPGTIGDYLRSLDPLQLNADQINAALALAGNVKTLFAAFEQLGPAMSGVTSLSVDAASALIQQAGGLQALSANVSSYYENYYSAEEKRGNLIRQITDTLNTAGFGVTQQQVAAGTTAQFRALAESLDVSTDSGRRMLAALMSVNAAFAQVAGTIDATTAATNAQILADVAKARSDLDAATAQAQQDQQAAVQDEIDQRQKLIESLGSTASELQSTAERFLGFARDLRAFRDQLLLGALSPLTPKQRYEEAARQFEATYAAAQGGDADAMGRLQEVSQAFLQASEVYNAHDAAYQADFARVQTALTLSAAKADALATTAQAQLATVKAHLSVAKAQLTSLQQINDTTAAGTLSVTDALAALGKTVAAALAAGLNPGAGNLAALTNGVTGEWVETSAGQIYTSDAGASVTGGSFTGGKIYSIDNHSYTTEEAVGYINNLIAAGRPTDAYYAFKSAGLSLADADKLMGWAPGYAEDWARANNLAVFDVGTNYVPRDMLAMVHEGEAIIPTAYNPAAGGGYGGGSRDSEVCALLTQVLAENRLMRQEHAQATEALQRAMRAASAEGAQHLARALEAAQSRPAWRRNLERAL